MRRLGFTMAPDLRVEIATASDGVADHFLAEYAAAAASTSDEADLTIEFRPVADPTIVGGHKTVRWRVELEPATSGPLRAAIDLRGHPRDFGLSLVQGYFVEPLLSLAAARAGRVLLPCAAIATEQTGLTLILGRSRSGKSSLAVRSLPGGAVVYGDDQAFIDASCALSRFPRRMRFYSDLRRTSPRAYARLDPRVRAGLVARGVVSTLTRGFVAPPVRVAIEELGTAGGLEPTAVDRVVLLERVDGITEIQHDEVGADATRDFAMNLLDEQRQKLIGAGPDWDRMITTLRSAESAMLRSAFQVHAVERLRVPMGWTATDALPVLAHLLRLPS